MKLQVRVGIAAALLAVLVTGLGRAETSTGEWLAGDLHVHTCYSHDTYCAPQAFCPADPDAGCPTEDYNTEPPEAYTHGGPMRERFAEAAARQLDYLAITDHHNDGEPAESGTRGWSDPGFGSFGVIGVHGYENSISGHAQMLGAKRVYALNEFGGDVNAMADALRADGGVFQANHPAPGLIGEFACDQPENLNWEYGYDVRLDTIEVWNEPYVMQPPFPSGSSNEDSVRYWECWLQRGAHVGATGGSDSHWMSTVPVQGIGNPTTWVFAPERSEHGVLAGLREGRTSIAFHPPIVGGPRLILEADVDGDGAYESMIGDTVPPGTAMRVRADGLTFTGLVEVRAGTVGVDIATIVDGTLLAPAGAVSFSAPSLQAQQRGWVRAALYLPDAQQERRENCSSIRPDNTSYCRNKILLEALTSPIYTG